MGSPKRGNSSSRGAKGHAVAPGTHTEAAWIALHRALVPYPFLDLSVASDCKDLLSLCARVGHPPVIDPFRSGDTCAEERKTGSHSLMF